jgi:hypothetical protein
MSAFVLLLLLFTPALSQFTLYLGMDVNQVSLGQDFFDCASGRTNYNRNGFIILPYVSTADFVGQIISAKKAGFLEVHLLINPDQFSLTNLESLAANTRYILWERGTGIAGIWLNVQSSASQWTKNTTQNIQLINSVLSSFQSTFTDTFGNVIVGVQTTQSDWEQVTGGDNTLPATGVLYWSAYGDSVNCDEFFEYGFNGCYLQQIQISNFGCNSPFNVDVKRVY